MKINIMGIPSAAGALHTGTEETSKSLRRAGLLDTLKNQGLEIIDHGDIIGGQKMSSIRVLM